MENFKASFFYNASPEIFRRADELRKNMTQTEKLIWDRINKKQINGLRFRRQHPIYKFIVDFYCHAAKLIVEIDGEIHNTSDVEERDEGREAELNNFDLEIVRFTNKEVLTNVESVIEKIKQKVLEKISLTTSQHV